MTRPAAASFGSLSQLLSYPDEEFAERAERIARSFQLEFPETARLLASFCQRLRGSTTEERQEQFIRVFDLNPVCALEVGWQLYGDQYERGRFLVFMRGLLRQLGMREDRELPDHLTHALELLDRMPAEDASQLAHCAVLPALDKMLAAIARLESPYEHVLQAAKEFLLARFALRPMEAGHA